MLGFELEQSISRNSIDISDGGKIAIQAYYLEIQR